MTSDDRSGRRIALAAVAGAHGIAGEVRLKLFTSAPNNLEGYRRLYVGGVATRLLRVRQSGRTVIARLDCCSDRASAEALRGSLIEVDRTSLPPLGEGEYYHADLIGLPVLDRGQSPIGTIVGVENYGAGDLLDVEKNDGSRALIPFRDGIADLVDGRVLVDSAFLA